MAHTFTRNAPPFVAKSLLESLRTPRPGSWRPSTGFTIGTYVYNQGRLFIASTNGQSAPSGTGPVHSSGAVQDGSITWIGLGPYVTIDGSINSNLYLGFGHNATSPWDDDENPPAPEDNPSSFASTIDNMVFALKLDPSDLVVGFPKVEWVTDTVYPQFDPDTTNVGNVVFNDSNLYKCIDNNGGSQSTVAPTGTNTGLIQTADGYVWKYLGGIDNYSMFRFSTPNYVPLPNVLPTIIPVDGSISTFSGFVGTGVSIPDTDIFAVEIIGDGTGAGAAARTEISGSDITASGIYAQASGSGYGAETYAFVYQDGAPGSGADLDTTVVAGEVTAIDLLAGGSDYVDASVIILGDGTGATATASISGGSINAVVVTDGGSGYTWAKAIAIPGTAGGAAKAVMAPIGGHGSNIEAESGASAILISKNVAIGNPNIPIDSDTTDGSFRQVSLIGGLVSEIRNAPAMIGKQHPNFSAPTTGQVKYVNGGTVIYINNLEPVIHSNAQEEVIKIVLNVTNI